MVAGRDQELHSSERFTIRRRLGEGGFGTVYEAYDNQRGAVVALKVLHRTDPTGLYRFKHEFRSLADIVHPNLVKLYDLISVQDQWFLTMELVQGVNFRAYVRGTQYPPSDSTRRSPSSPADVATTAAAGAAMLNQGRMSWPDSPSALPPQGISRLREALRQLVNAISALHRLGILHCDIKPSNVLVTNSGRVLLLDFGLATHFGSAESAQTVSFAGTPQYMSPEHAAGYGVSEASDWYSAGVMLYEALTGLPLFSGSLFQIFQDKQRLDPPSPSVLVPGIPEDLDVLCQDLLRRDPALRPSGAEVLSRVGAAQTLVPSVTEATGEAEAPRFIGRTHHLAVINETFEAMKTGQMAVVAVHGGSGMGKTALVRHFLRTLRATARDVVVLTGRCREQEAVPYKALDNVVDELAHYLRRLSDAQAESLMPRGVSALARLFPVLLRVDAVAAPRRVELDIPDVHELRRRAFTALRELLGRLAERSPLVIFIDDLQWGDIDSAALLAEVLRPPDHPTLLLIISYRTEEAETSPILQKIFPLQGLTGAATLIREVEVDELKPEEAAELARTLMGGDRPRDNRADIVVRESAGCPFLIDQLARYGELAGPEATLDAILLTRASHLPERSRRLLEIIALAGRPLDLSIAQEAADLGPENYDVVLALRAARFVRTRVTGDRIQVESYHDRIRETMVAALSPETFTHHQHRLALAIEAFGYADPEVLALHFQRAGANDKAARYARTAAAQAAQALAFDRAARLYRLALDLDPADSPRRRVLWTDLAAALESAGRPIEAARAYLAAREGATRTERLDVERLAAEQLLIGGHLDEGIALLTSVLSEYDLALPATPARALFSFAFGRVYVRIRGIKFRERSEAEVPPEDLRRIDLCNSVCRGLGLIDPIQAIAFQTRHLLLALRIGEPYRVARALTYEATADASRRRGHRRAEQLLQRAGELAHRIQHPHALALFWLNSGMADLLGGRWKRALKALRRGERLCRERLVALPHEIVISQLFTLSCLHDTGRFRTYFRRVPEFLSESRDRGDLYAETNLRIHNACVKCYREDNPDGAVKELEDAMARWSGRNVSMEHATALLRSVEFALYAGDTPHAWQLLTERWSSVAPLLLFRIQVWLISALYLRARGALGMLAETHGAGSRKPFQKSAERDARRIERQRSHWGAPLAHLVYAGLAVDAGDSARGIELLAAAETGFQNADMAVHKAAARRRRGALVGGDEGRSLIEAADRWMLSQGIKNPLRMSAMIAPGRWGR